MKRIWSSPITIIVSLLVVIFCGVWLYQEAGGKALNSLKKTEKSSLNMVLSAKAIVQQPITVSVLLDTKKNNVNAAGVYLRFDPQKLQLLNMDTRASFCQYYPEKKFDNALGTVSLACGSPHPGVSGTNTLMVLEFLPLSVGTTKISTDARSQIIKSDGGGTNILAEFPMLDIPIYTGL